MRIEEIFNSLPLPIGCWEEGSYQQHTLLVRLPQIARRVLDENQLPVWAEERVRALVEDIPEGRMRDLMDVEAPDTTLWQGYMELLQGKTWRELTFLQAEKVFYRRVIEAVGYYQAGETFGKDPYALQKRLGLETSRDAVSGLARRLEMWRAADRHDALIEAVESMLWGNRADLSLWPAGDQGTASPKDLHQAEEFLIVSDLTKTVQELAELGKGRVDILADNAGYELICDLAFADLLIGMGIAQGVRLHVKTHPTFVSDAIAEDVYHTVEEMADAHDVVTQGFGRRLVESIGAGCLEVRSDFFWTAPLPFWAMPQYLAAELKRANWLFCKGDANYRCLTGDLHWAAETPFEKVTAYFPTKITALRVVKSDVIVGLMPGQTEQLGKLDPNWRIDGRWGMVQVKA